MLLSPPSVVDKKWYLLRHSESLLDDGRVEVVIVYGNAMRPSQAEIRVKVDPATLSKYPLTLTDRVLEMVQRSVAAIEAQPCEPCPKEEMTDGERKELGRVAEERRAANARADRPRHTGE